MMENIHEDALILIFRSYLEESSTMLISLMAVCRRWHNIINGTPSLSFRIAINVKRYNQISAILSSSGFQNYLARTDGTDILLDIEVQCHWHSMEVLDGPSRYVLGSEVLRDLGTLFTFLAGIKPNTVGTEKELVPVSQLKPRIHRWQFFLFETSGFFRTWDDPKTSVEKWIQNPSYYAPQLSHLTLRGVPPWYEPHKGFAPNLVDLTVGTVPPVWKYRSIYTPSLMSLSLEDVSYIDWDNMSGVCTVEKLGIWEPRGDERMRIDIKFPNLKKLKIQTNASHDLLSHLSKQFSDSGSRLEVVYLIEFEFWDLPLSPENISILTSAQKIVLSDSGSGDDDPVDLERDVLHLKRFLQLCAKDTEIVAVGEVSGKALAMACT